MKVLGIIPARYASSRFPGKPLAIIDGKPMVQHVYERVNKMGIINDAIVATDDERIAACVKGFGGKAMMTGKNHRSGTDRCGEVLQRLGEEAGQYEVVINIQGDEPFVDESQLQTLIEVFQQSDSAEIATLKKEITEESILFSPNAVKVVCTPQGKALYFSRQPLPYLRGCEPSLWLTHTKYYKHIGIYAFRRTTLEQVVTLKQTPLELCESLEQLRWLENGFSIEVRETKVENASVDTPEDLQKLINKLV
jgi:3-deoxy-manno-octulosonate cytidylyltransferase (CMP-KDO synthetase)